MAHERSYQQDAALPLFREDSPKSRAADILFGVVTVVTVLITIILSFTRGSVQAIHIFFGVTIILISIPQVILVRWFRNGDLDPKFRYLIAYMMLSIVLLCICAVIYFYKDDKCN